MSTCYTSKENIFQIKLNFKQKNYVVFKKNQDNSNFYFFVKLYADLGVFNCKVFKFLQRNLETELLCALERF